MSDVSVIGLGAMGAAIARAVLQRGMAVTVWNRSAQKCAAFRDTAAIAATAADAIGCSPVTLICIDDYSATRELLEAPAAAAAADGRTLLQFSTGTPAEAREAEARAHAMNARWLDGAILAYPREIGDAALICVSGDEFAYAECRNVLAALSSDVRYLGAPVGAAAALDVAVLSYYVCTHLGLVHGAMICRSERVPVDMLSSIIVDSLPSDSEELAHLGAALQQQTFDRPGASLGVYHGVLQRVLSQARDAGLNDEIPRFAAGIVERGMQAGLADEEVVSVIKVLEADRG